MATDWLPVTVLLPVVLFKAEVSADGMQVRGKTIQGKLAILAVEWLDEESRERVREVLEAENHGSGGVIR